MSWGKDQYGLVKIWINRPCDGYYLRWWYNGWHYWYFLPGTIYFDTEGEDYYTLGTQKIAMCSGQINYGQCQAIRTILNAVDIDIWTDVGWKSTRLERDSVVVYDNKVNGYEIEFVMIMGSRKISDSGYSPIINIPPIPPGTWIPECVAGNCVIGTQVWMGCNYDIAYPGSRVYDDDEANRAIYGGLYTYNQVITAGFAPTGWHVPTEAEWTTLITYLGGTLVAGGSLKDSSSWNAPNPLVPPISCFEALAAGDYNSTIGAYQLLGDFCYFRTVTPDLATTSRIVYLSSITTEANISSVLNTQYMSVRLLRDTPATSIDMGYGALYNWYAVNGDI